MMCKQEKENFNSDLRRNELQPFIIVMCVGILAVAVVIILTTIIKVFS